MVANYLTVFTRILINFYMCIHQTKSNQSIIYLFIYLLYIYSYLLCKTQKNEYKHTDYYI